MTLRTIEPEQQTAAKVAGFIYLIAMATSMFAELYARAPLIVRGDAMQTAINIVASERLFRIGSVIHLITFASDAILAVALYVVLRPINRNVALPAAFWRLADCSILAVNLLNGHLLSNHFRRRSERCRLSEASPCGRIEAWSSFPQREIVGSSDCRAQHCRSSDHKFRSHLPRATPYRRAIESLYEHLDRPSSVQRR